MDQLSMLECLRLPSNIGFLQLHRFVVCGVCLSLSVYLSICLLYVVVVLTRPFIVRARDSSAPPPHRGAMWPRRPLL